MNSDKTGRCNFISTLMISIWLLSLTAAVVIIHVQFHSWSGICGQSKRSYEDDKLHLTTEELLKHFVDLFKDGSDAIGRVRRFESPLLNVSSSNVVNLIGHLIKQSLTTECRSNHSVCKGNQGDQGQSGEPGYNGEKGENGEQGEKGMQGERGVAGIQGSRGEQGVKGMKGDEGPRGVKGGTGMKGDHGMRGEKGYVGEQGLKGDEGGLGLQGLNGDKGMKGDQGMKGEKENVGDQGPMGEKGDMGITGLKGEEGVKGDQGMRGDKGDVGELGPKGSLGIPGLKGDRGDQGLCGQKVENGSNCVCEMKLPRECSNYTILEEPWRKVSSTNIGSVFECDRWTPAGWKRFADSIGGQMPNSCPSIFSCGTNAPGWFNGTYPKVTGQRSTGLICFNWTEKCCRWQVPVEVVNCSSYYVYNLPRAPLCSLAYCSDA